MAQYIVVQSGNNTICDKKGGWSQMASDKHGSMEGNGKALLEKNSLRINIDTEEEVQNEVQEVVEYKEGVMDIPEETINAFSGDELRARVFYEKYALRDERGKIVEKTPDEMWRRVAIEIASPEKTQKLRKEWEEKFYWLLSDFKFIPGGRILFGAGQKRRATLLNCYFMPIKEDSIESIFEWCKEAARTYSFGGGVGTDISNLRPKGSPVNISVRVTDEFMKAVEEDKDFELRFENEKVKFHRKIRARDLWKKLVKSAWASAEPGVVFWDAVKKFSPTEYNGMEIHGFNPCSEQALEDYGNCCLGNVNLSLFVKDEFTDRASIDWENLELALRFSVRFLDDVLDYNFEKHPLKAQKEASQRSRRIGVGFTGFGDMLAKLNLKFDTPEAVEFADKMFEYIKNIVYEASSDFAAEKGSFPAFDLDSHLSRPFITTLDA